MALVFEDNSKRASGCDQLRAYAVIEWSLFGEGYPMSFQAKVKETAQLFVATNEVDKDRAWGKDARKLEKGKSYVGYLFPALSEYSSKPGAFGRPTCAIFESDALEVLSVRVKLVVE
jgi:hypothetical protein